MNHMEIGLRAGFVLAVCMSSVPAWSQVSDESQDAADTDAAATAVSEGREQSTRAKADGFSAEVGLEVRYDSNVVIDDIDLNTGLGDEALRFTASAEYEAAIGEKTTLTGGYRFSQLAYEEFSNLDLTSHSLSAKIEHEFADLDASLSYRFTHASLGGEGFVELHRFSPSLSGYASSDVLLRGAYIFTHKNFLARDDRDAQTHAIDADLYWLANGSRTYFVFGYRFEDEDARDPQFSFRGNEFSARFVQRFNIAKERARLRMAARYEERDYAAQTPSIGAIRRDDRLRLSAGLEWQVARNLELAASYEYSDFESNLPVADYDQSLVSLQLLFAF